MVTACASGAHAIGDSFRMISQGDADVMISGGLNPHVQDLALQDFVL